MERSVVRLKKYVWLIAVLWTVSVAGLLVKDLVHLNRTLHRLALSEARSYIDKFEAFRLWVASQGGVYVPVTEDTAPNPYLSHIPERDLLTPSGKRLTLMNAAHILRQVVDYYSDFFGIEAHFASLKFSRQETAPDEWERAALMTFEKGGGEALSFSEIEGQPYLRMMRPLIMESSCLKCHGQQGYEVGDIHGGLSIAVPMLRYHESWSTQIAFPIVSFFILWVLGLGGLAIVSRRLEKSLMDRNRAIASLQASQATYKSLVDSSLTGIYLCQKGKFVYVNSEFARIHGYSQDEIIGMDILSLVHPAERSVVADRMAKRLAGEEVSSEYQVRCLTQSGEVIWVQRSNTITTYNDAPAVLGNEIDITRRKYTEVELKASERQLKWLANRLLEIQETERQEFAREIHENIAQSLSAIKMRVESVIEEAQREAAILAYDSLQPVVVDVQQTVNEIRKVAARYRPLGLDSLGLISTILWLCRELIRVRPEIRIDRQIQICESDIPERFRIVLFRVVEQTLHDLSSIYGFHEIEITLKKTTRKIVLKITGRVQASNHSRSPADERMHSELTLVMLQRRAASVGGGLRFWSDLNGSAATLLAYLPVEDTCSEFHGTPARRKA